MLKNINRSDPNHKTNYLERPRIYRLLENAMEYPLVVVCAGSGYGKTLAVSSFFEKYDAIAPWMQISEKDNISVRIWESISRMASVVSKEYGSALWEIGFPTTNEAYLKFHDTVEKYISAQPGKCIGVFDDFHLLHNPEILRFFIRMVNSAPANMKIVLITRTMPEINLIGMIMRDYTYIIQEDALCFTEDEISLYFDQLNLQVPREDIRDIYADTHGWSFAVNLIGRSLAHEHKYERHNLGAMKKNIFRFIEAEISQIVSQALWHFLLRISLIEYLATDLVKMLAKDEAIIKEMELLTAYIRYDFNQDTYLIHHLLLAYLRRNQDQLTAEEKKETYQVAGEWCDANGYNMDALAYYEKAADYSAIMRMITSVAMQMPSDVAQYALYIFERMPDKVKSQNMLFPSMYLKLKINLGHFEEASAFAERWAKDYEARPESPQRSRVLATIYAFWGLVRMKMCTYTDEYDFDMYPPKVAENYDKNTFKPLGSYKEIISNAWASYVGTTRPGAMEEYIDAVSRSTPFISHVFKGYYAGYADLLRGELCFYRREFNDAEQYLKQTIVKACMYDQYVTHIMALVYLMNVDFSRGDFISATARLNEIGELINVEGSRSRSSLYDIAHGFYQLTLDQPEQIPKWLKSDFAPFRHSLFLEKYANRIRARYHYATHKYRALLTFIESTKEQPTILFDRIELKVLQALTLYKLKQRNEAIAALTEAYYFAESNKISEAFTEFGKDMRTLTLTALKQNTCRIPREWLENINNISSVYAKRKIKMIAEYRRDNNIEEKIKLTEREIAVLGDLSRGFSRMEIADNQGVSINTVKMVTQAIYNKLKANGLADAIRIAVDLKIIQ